MKNLIAALQKQKNLLEELRDVLKKETGELSEVHLDAMAETNARKEEIADVVKSHATVLRSAIQEVATLEGLSPKATLGELATSLKKKGNREIAQFHDDLNVLADQTRELLTLNREIAERFALSLGDTLNFIARIINQTSTYGASGSYLHRPAGAVMINREA